MCNLHVPISRSSWTSFFFHSDWRRLKNFTCILRPFINTWSNFLSSTPLAEESFDKDHCLDHYVQTIPSISLCLWNSDLTYLVFTSLSGQAIWPYTVHKGYQPPPTSKSSPPLIRSSPFLKIPHSPTLLPNPNTQHPQKHHIHLSFARPPLKSAICPSLPPFRQSSLIYCFYVNSLKNHIFQLTSILKFSFLNLILSFKSNYILR